MGLVIQVCGDPTIDWLSVRNNTDLEKSSVYFWASAPSLPIVSLGSQAGGSALLIDLIEAMVKAKAQVQGKRPDRRLLKEPFNNRITNSWTAWRPYIDKGGSKAAFRLCEWQGYEQGNWSYESNRLKGTSDLLVIEDSGIGFRNLDKGWPETLSEGTTFPQCILYKLAKYAGENQNPLLNRINDLGLGERTTIITSLNDVRACAVKIGASLSWEMLFEDIVQAIYSRSCPFVEEKNGKLKYARIIVTIGTGGAVVITSDHDALIFDREGQEDDFSARHPGEVMGYNSCVLSALAAHWIEKQDSMDWCEAVRDGMGLARHLHLEGYAVVKGKSDGDGKSRLRFPFESIAEEYYLRQKNGLSKKSEAWNLGIYHMTCNGGVKTLAANGGWSILEESVKGKRGMCQGVSDAMNAIIERARNIVIKGPVDALPDIPLETVGNWRSADRQEIEGVRSVNNAIRNYIKGQDAGTPLCIAVFGPPGAGKSFAIKEIARQLGIEKDMQLTFNLSQFVSPEELAAAFHQIRDLNLKGKKPLVFWDEFDTPFENKPLGWLKYFLAPMQDAEFTEHGRVHPVGGGIYVFAGATRHSFNDFCDNVTSEEVSAKKPDFISRLKAYIDVKGPNAMPNTVADRQFIIRRAFLLNAFLNTNAKNVKGKDGFIIEQGVMDAFLCVNKYKHGARSMETLIKMSSLSGKRKYELSSLPPRQILDMHVNAKDFLLLTRYGHMEMLRIGITGHIGLDPKHLASIKDCIMRAIAFIEDQYPNRLMTVFSPMAMGADRLVARMLLKKEEVGLIAVLPMPMNDYLSDFGVTDNHNAKVVGRVGSQDAAELKDIRYRYFACDNAYSDAEARQEFRYWLSQKATEVIELPQTATRDEAYLQAGYFIAENSDLLIALWDGNEAQGKGGTGDIVQKALEYKKPVIHVWAGNYKEDPAKRTDVGDKIGKFRHINFRMQNNWCE